MWIVGRLPTKKEGLYRKNRTKKEVEDVLSIKMLNFHDMSDKVEDIF